DLDLAAGNALEPNRFYQNNGSGNPFNGVTGKDIGAGSGLTASVVAADVDGDGDLDLVAARTSAPSLVFQNNGTLDPFDGVAGFPIRGNEGANYGASLGDFDGDGDLDLVAARNGEVSQVILNQ